jgi:hypothetical protein
VGGVNQELCGQLFWGGGCHKRLGPRTALFSVASASTDSLCVSYSTCPVITLTGRAGCTWILIHEPPALIWVARFGRADV